MYNIKPQNITRNKSNKTPKKRKPRRNELFDITNLVDYNSFSTFNDAKFKPFDDCEEVEHIKSFLFRFRYLPIKRNQHHVGRLTIDEFFQAVIMESVIKLLEQFPKDRVDEIRYHDVFMTVQRVACKMFRDEVAHYKACGLDVSIFDIENDDVGDEYEYDDVNEYDLTNKVGTDPEALFLQREELDSFFDQLSDKEREIVNYRLQGYTIQETSEFLGNHRVYISRLIRGIQDKTGAELSFRNGDNKWGSKLQWNGNFT